MLNQVFEKIINAKVVDKKSIADICSELTREDIQKLIEKIKLFRSEEEKEHEQRVNQMYDHETQRVMIRGSVDDSYSDFCSEQNDNIFRGEAEMLSRKLSQIDHIIGILQNLQAT